MDARRYGISLRVFNSIAHEWAQRTSEMSSWTQETMYYFFYHINTRALYCAEKPSSFMNDNKWIDNRRLTIVRWKTALNHDYKNNNSRNFQFTKFSFIDFVFTDRRSLSGKQPKLASSKFSCCRFSSSAERNANTKATKYVNFGFSLSQKV